MKCFIIVYAILHARHSKTHSGDFGENILAPSPYQHFRQKVLISDSLEPH